MPRGNFTEIQEDSFEDIKVPVVLTSVNTISKKGKKYYVQVRYYYYDSTNKKVYGTYSKVKSVKAYQQ